MNYEDKLALALDIFSKRNIPSGYDDICYWGRLSVSIYYDSLLETFHYEHNDINTGHFDEIPDCDYTRTTKPGANNGKSSKFNLKELFFNLTHKESLVYCFTILFIDNKATFTESETTVDIKDDFGYTLVDEIEREFSELTTMDFCNGITESNTPSETVKEKIYNYRSTEWLGLVFIHRTPMFYEDFDFYVAISNLEAANISFYTKSLYKFIETFSIISTCQDLDDKTMTELFDRVVYQLGCLYYLDALSIIYKVAVKAKKYKYKISRKKFLKLSDKECDVIKSLYMSGIIDVPFYIKYKLKL